MFRFIVDWLLVDKWKRRFLDPKQQKVLMSVQLGMKNRRRTTLVSIYQYEK